MDHQGMLSPSPPQPPRAVVMVRPHHFTPNPMTLVDNSFMTTPDGTSDEVAHAAYDEVTRMVDQLSDAGVTVHLVEDAGRETPDSVFPNNWFTTHADGSLAVHPMRAQDRRAERRQDVLDLLHERYVVRVQRDYSHWELEGRFLEGTGAMVIDHRHRVLYVCRSGRTDDGLLDMFCTDHGYRPVVFDASDSAGTAVYHTNVMMAIGTDVTLATLDLIRDREQRSQVREELQASGRTLVELTEEQVGEFAGNALEVSAGQGSVLVMSARGWASLRFEQRELVEAAVPVLTVRIPTLEHAGGSARCMLAGIHLPVRPAAG